MCGGWPPFDQRRPWALAFSHLEHNLCLPGRRRSNWHPLLVLLLALWCALVDPVFIHGHQRVPEGLSISVAPHNEILCHLNLFSPVLLWEKARDPSCCSLAEFQVIVQDLVDAANRDVQLLCNFLDLDSPVLLHHVPDSLHVVWCPDSHPGVETCSAFDVLSAVLELFEECIGHGLGHWLVAIGLHHHPVHLSSSVVGFGKAFEQSPLIISRACHWSRGHCDYINGDHNSCSTVLLPK